MQDKIIIRKAREHPGRTLAVPEAYSFGSRCRVYGTSNLKICQNRK